MHKMSVVSQANGCTESGAGYDALRCAHAVPLQHELVFSTFFPAILRSILAPNFPLQFRTSLDPIVALPTPFFARNSTVTAHESAVLISWPGTGSF